MCLFTKGMVSIIMSFICWSSFFMSMWAYWGKWKYTYRSNLYSCQSTVCLPRYKLLCNLGLASRIKTNMFSIVVEPDFLAIKKGLQTHSQIILSPDFYVLLQEKRMSYKPIPKSFCLLNFCVLLREKRKSYKPIPKSLYFHRFVYVLLCK